MLKKSIKKNNQKPISRGLINIDFWLDTFKMSVDNNYFFSQFSNTLVLLLINIYFV